jgi:hypothetical protein
MQDARRPREKGKKRSRWHEVKEFQETDRPSHALAARRATVDSADRVRRSPGAQEKALIGDPRLSEASHRNHRFATAVTMSIGKNCHTTISLINRIDADQ